MSGVPGGGPGGGAGCDGPDGGGYGFGFFGGSGVLGLGENRLTLRLHVSEITNALWLEHFRYDFPPVDIADVDSKQDKK